MVRTKKSKSRPKPKKNKAQVSYETTEFVITMIEAVLLDEFKFTPEQMHKFKSTLNRSCKYISDGCLLFQEVKGIIHSKYAEGAINEH